jgi:hypothetical protein
MAADQLPLPHRRTGCGLACEVTGPESSGHPMLR